MNDANAGGGLVGGIAKCVPHVCPTISHRKLSTASPASAVQQLLTHLETTVKITP